MLKKIYFLIFMLLIFISFVAYKYEVHEQPQYNENTSTVVTNNENLAKIKNSTEEITTDMISTATSYTMFKGGISEERMHIQKIIKEKYNIIQIDDGWQYEYHIFLDKRYINSIYLPNQCGVDPSPNIKSFNNHIWLILDEVIGKGTGLLEVEEAWYDITLGTIPEILRYTKVYIYNANNEMLNINYNADISVINATDCIFSIELKKIYTIENPETSNQMLSVETISEYHLDDRNGDFIAEFYPTSDLTFNHNSKNIDIILDNYDTISELLASEDEEKRQWANRLIDSVEDEINKLNSLNKS